MYSDGTLSLRRFCNHTIDYVRIDVIKNHIKNQKHVADKEYILSTKNTENLTEISYFYIKQKRGKNGFCFLTKQSELAELELDISIGD